MKLATMRDGSRDGRLLVVNRALTRGVLATGVAQTLQVALDGWSENEARLKVMFDRLQAGRAPDAFDLDLSRLAAPLPRPTAGSTAASISTIWNWPDRFGGWSRKVIGASRS